MPKLTTQEATQLINMLKQLVEKNIYFPNQGERKELEAEGVVDQSEKFIISIIRGGRDPKKCSYQARMKTGGTPLLRLDITGPSIAHQNPDGTIIYGPHLLAYNEDFDMKYAVRFDPNDEDLINICFEFFRKFNIMEGVNIQPQLMN